MSFYRTYKELKRIVITMPCVAFVGFYRTYKELKHLSSFLACRAASSFLSYL